jgi:hypothetical protein
MLVILGKLKQRRVAGLIDQRLPDRGGIGPCIAPTLESGQEQCVRCIEGLTMLLEQPLCSGFPMLPTQVPRDRANIGTLGDGPMLHLDQGRDQSRQRQQVEPVVSEDRAEPGRLTASQPLEPGCRRL